MKVHKIVLCACLIFLAKGKLFCQLELDSNYIYIYKYIENDGSSHLETLSLLSQIKIRGILIQKISFIPSSDEVYEPIADMSYYLIKFKHSYYYFSTFNRHVDFQKIFLYSRSKFEDYNDEFQNAKMDYDYLVTVATVFLEDLIK